MKVSLIIICSTMYCFHVSKTVWGCDMAKCKMAGLFKPLFLKGWQSPEGRNPSHVGTQRDYVTCVSVKRNSKIFVWLRRGHFRPASLYSLFQKSFRQSRLHVGNLFLSPKTRTNFLVWLLRWPPHEEKRRYYQEIVALSLQVQLVGP